MTPQPSADEAIVTLHTELGQVTLRVETARAPTSAADFLRYVDAHAYDGGVFDRLVRPDNDRGHPVISAAQARIAHGAGSLGFIGHEPTSATGLRHLDGVVSLPRLGVGTGTAARFFICVGDQPSLDAGGRRNPDGAGFAAFGRVLDGMQVVREIHRQPCTSEADEEYIRGQVPKKPVRILRARRVG